MKKLIAISVVFALVAGAAFAADIGAEVFGNVELANGSTNGYHKEKVDGKDKQVKDDAGTGYSEGRIRLQGSGENDDGTFGGWTRFQAGSQGGNVSAWGYGWWKPIEQVRFLIGSNGGDGFFSADGVTRWGFYQVAGDVGIIKPDNAWGSASWAWTGLNINYSSAFYGGFDNGAILTITPMEPLEINIGIPYGGAAKDTYQQTNAQVAYTIDGIGKFALTYAGALGKLKAVEAKDLKGKVTGKYKVDDIKDVFKMVGGTDADWDALGDDGQNEFIKTIAATVLSPTELLAPSGSTLYVYFGLSAIENLGIDIGLGYTLPAKGDKENGTDGVTYNAPIAAGLGVTFNAGEFGVKARTVANFGGKIEDYKIPLELLFDVLPSYAVNESLTVLLSAGIGYQAADDKKLANANETRLAWHAQPYVTIKSSWWAPNLYAGIRIETDGKKTYGEKGDATNINWSIPIGIAYAF